MDNTTANETQLVSISILVCVCVCVCVCVSVCMNLCMCVCVCMCVCMSHLNSSIQEAVVLPRSVDQPFVHHKRHGRITSAYLLSVTIAWGSGCRGEQTRQ